MTDEDPFLHALLENENDTATRLVYADWLEERGDPRGEFLRIEAYLYRARPTTQKYTRVRDRLLELGENIDATWLAIVSRPRIRGVRYKHKHNGGRVVDFLPDGTMVYEPMGTEIYDGKWKQIGKHISMSWKFKEGRKVVQVLCEGTIRKRMREIDATARRAAGKKGTWPWVFVPLREW